MSVKKHRVLFIIPAFNIGGTNSVLNNICANINTSCYEVAIFTLRREGTLKNEFVNSRCLENRLLMLLNLSFRTEKNILRILFAFCLRVLNRTLHIVGLNLVEFINNRAANILSQEKYDTVVAFQEGEVTKFASKIKSTNNIAWIHSCYDRYFELTNHPNELAIYEKYCKIICVSEHSKKMFVKFYPQLKDNVIVIYNVQNVERIKKLSRQTADVVFPGNCFKIISVGRFDPVKRFWAIPFIASELKEKGVNFKWYIVGDGLEMPLIKNNIDKYSVSDCVCLLGTRVNPYIFISQADLLVVLSESESYPMVINEAKILGIPVLTSDFPTAKEVVKKEEGIIVPFSDLSKNIANLFFDKKQYLIIKNGVEKFSYNNDALMTKIEELFSNNMFCKILNSKR